MTVPLHDSRTLARELAFQFLYQRQFLSHENPFNTIELFNSFLTSLEAQLSPPHKAFAIELITGSLKHLNDIEETIANHCKDWKLDRLASIDRTILVLAIFELQYYKQNPPKTVINEAINLAKKFGNESSGSFINGLLDQIATL